MKKSLRAQLPLILLCQTYTTALPNAYTPLSELGVKKTDTMHRAQSVSPSTNTISIKHFDSIQECFNYANQCFINNKLEEALVYYEKTLEMNRNLAPAYFNRGICLYRLERHDDALASFLTAIENAPTHAKAHFNAAKIYEQRKEFDKAMEHLTTSIQYDRDNADSHRLLGKLYTNNEDFEKALESFNQAQNLQPENIGITFERANTLNALNRMQDAYTLYKQVLDQNPRSSTVLYNIAYTLKKLGKIDDAIHFYKQALEINPNSANTRFSLALTYLSQGNWQDGWLLYESRFDNDPNLRKKEYSQPRWSGQDLTNKKIFLYAEQGLGDTFQFIRFARVAKERGAHVIVAVQPPLMHMLNRCDYIDTIISIYDTPPAFDYHAPLMSMPALLGTRVETVPTTPYLHAKPELITYWRDKLSDDHNFKIAINWEGNSRQTTPYLRALVKKRCLNAQEFDPVAQVPGVSLYSLQKIVGENQPTSFTLKTFGQELDEQHGRFEDTAAIMKNVDLVITNDTSIAHLAGGLGVPVWTILPEPADWRWMFERLDTPWYPTMRLFRQFTTGDWSSLMQHVAQELEKEVHGRNSTVVTRQHPLQKSTPHHADLYTDMQKEKDQLEAQLNTINQKIRSFHAVSPTDPTFQELIKQFYLISQLHTHIVEKMTLYKNI